MFQKVKKREDKIEDGSVTGCGCQEFLIRLLLSNWTVTHNTSIYFCKNHKTNAWGCFAGLNVCCNYQIRLDGWLRSNLSDNCNDNLGYTDKKVQIMLIYVYTDHLLQISQYTSTNFWMCYNLHVFSVWFSFSRRKLALPPTCAQVIPISRPSSGKKCPDFCQNRLFKELVNYGLHVLISGSMKELVWHLREMYVMKVLYPNTQFHFIV